MDTFHRTWIYGVLVLALVSCVSCSMGGKKAETSNIDPSKLEQIIKAARKAGCVVKGVSIDSYMETVNITCQGGI